MVGRSIGTDEYRLTANVFGKFSLTDSVGNDCTPRAMKAKGLLALLIASPNMERTRSWLQSKLWSDRSPDQAAGSLRRSLSDIRKAFGEHRDVLISDFSSVALDLENLSINYTIAENRLTENEVEAFEGIDIKDFEFEALIRDIRTAFTKKASSIQVSTSSKRCIETSHTTKLTLIVENLTQEGGRGNIASQIFSDKIIRYMCQLGPFEILTSNGFIIDAQESDPANNSKMCYIRVRAVPCDSNVFLSCEVGIPIIGRLCWSDSIILSNEPQSYYDDIEMAKLTGDAVAQLCKCFAQDPAEGSNEQYAFCFAQKSKRLLFDLGHQSLLDADMLLIKAHKMYPHGALLAWRAFLRLTAKNQHYHCAVFDESAPFDDLLAEAVRLTPHHPSVQAICSQIELFNQGSAQFSLDLAQRSFKGNSSDPLICAMLSNALIKNQRFEESYKVACRALSLSRHHRNHYYFQHFACMSACANENYDAALLHAEIGTGLRPDFVSLQRYHLALTIQKKSSQQMYGVISALEKNEPGFVVSRLVDPSYPVPTLFGLPLIDKVALYIAKGLLH